MKELVILLEKQKFRFRKAALTDDFVKSLQPNDLFSFHCREFVKYLGFKRCDKKFRERFEAWLKEQQIKYVVSNRNLTATDLHNFFNAEKVVEERMNERVSSAYTQRQWFEYLAKEFDKSFDEIVKVHVGTIRNMSLFEVKEDKQKLSGSFNGGCWLILWKQELASAGKEVKECLNN